MTDIVDTLNSYDGEDIWGEVILRLPGYDETATDALGCGYYSDRFVAAGVEYRATSGKWVAT